ncbi:MAG: hypothetical protein AAGB18_00960, partial [Pseudomonadota bacterium]
MTLEERLADARRRRAVVLATRSTTRAPVALSAVMPSEAGSEPPPLLLGSDQRSPVPKPDTVASADLSGLQTPDTAEQSSRRLALRPLAYGGLVAAALAVAMLLLQRDEPPLTHSALSVTELGTPVLTITPVRSVPAPPIPASAPRDISLARPNTPGTAIGGALPQVPAPPLADEQPVTEPRDITDALVAEALGTADTLVRIFVPSSSANSERVSSVVSGIEAAPWRIDGVGQVPFAVSATHVRYYHSADREAAQRLAADAGG